MEHFARLRPRLTKLWLAFLILFGVSALISFFSVYKLENWQRYSIWGIGGALFLIGFVFPSLAFAMHYVDVTSEGLQIRQGFKSSKRVNLAWNQISSISHSPIRGILITSAEGNETVLRGYPFAKQIVRELNRLGGK